MLASLVEAPLDDPQFVYEPKYDGIRAIVEVGKAVHLWSRLGNEKTAQFPAVVAALEQWKKRLKQPVVVDGEIVALDREDKPAGFQMLQQGSSNTAIILFDVLKIGARDLRDRPLTERRAELEKLVKGSTSRVLRISEQVRGGGRELYERALAGGWEGLIAKRADSEYKSGKRTPDWRKLKINQEQEFVVGGWTEPRQTRAYFGALLLGIYRSGRLVYVGHTGTGFNEKELARVMKLLKPLETKECPFDPRPKTNEQPHWVKPQLVAQIKFTEWTADEKLRHPVYLGLRDDKKATDVVRETKRKVRTSGIRQEESAAGGDLVEQLRAIEASRRDGTITLPDGATLGVTNLQKIFWPKQKLTKGDLFRYYAQIAPAILPAIADRPLTMKRYPNGIAAEPFYQHRAPDKAPDGVRIERVKGEKTVPSRFIGGSLITLLYMTQLASISQDPWFSRVKSVRFADHVALDLDPPDGTPFPRVLEVAKWIRDELDALGVTGVPKTSGSRGLHIYIPLPPETPYDAGMLLCQIIATVVSQKHPRQATVERSVAARGTRIYVDYLQNIQGKTLATAYSARASAYAGVSAPLTWKEIDEGVDREDFTIASVPARVAKVGDLWKALRSSKGVDLSRIERYTRNART
jgi:bifunctional non-homologous end joining protein LigD